MFGSARRQVPPALSSSEAPPHAFPGRAGLNRIGVHNQLWQNLAYE